VGAYLVEIVRDGDLAGEESGATHGSFLRGIDGGQFDDGLTGLGDDDGVALSRLFDEAGKVGFGFVDINGAGCLHMD